MPATIKQNAYRPIEVPIALKRVEPEKSLNALTSLRFLAAAMIVVSHSVAIFHLDPRAVIANIPLHQGVSFFFVLSGFILSYVHPDLVGMKKILSFYSARFSRVYPAFFFTTVLTFFVVPKTVLAGTPLMVALTVASQFFLVHSWIPQKVFYASLNAPSWSVSNELLFYLVFPFLINNLSRNWLPKLLVIGSLPLIFVAITGAANLPLVADNSNFDCMGLTYFNPLCRITEFYIGMLTWLIFKKITDGASSHRFATSRTLSTVLELSSLGLFAFILGIIMHLLSWTTLTTRWPVVAHMLEYSANDITCMAIIIIFALGRGFISNILKGAPFIFLGEASYSLYLLHFPLIWFYLKNEHLFSAYPRLIRYGLFWSTLIVSSTATYLLLEKPCRQILKDFFQAKIAALKSIQN